MSRAERQMRAKIILLIIILLLSLIGNYMTLSIIEEQEKLIQKQRELIEVQKEHINILDNAFQIPKVVQAVEPIEEVVIEPIIFNVSAYCPCIKCCGKTDGITKSGNKAQSNLTIAMDKEYPMGTKVMIEGFEDIVFEKQDIGGAIKGNKIDIFFDTHEEALKFGRHNLKVWILPSELSESTQLAFNN